MRSKCAIFALDSKILYKMKKYILAFAAAGIVFSAWANFTGDGYYRVRNYGSGRWCNLIDNKATVDKVSATAELHALELTSDTEEILTDPGSIVRITKVGKNNYDLSGQGVSLESLIGYTMSMEVVGNNDGQDLYYLYGTYKGASKYLGDADMTDNVEGNASVNAANKDYRKWLVLPVNTSDNYFGVQPVVTAGGTGYTTVFAEFAYQPYSAGVKAYYISRVGYGMAEMIEITGAVPAGSPVIIQCAGPNSSDNKMELKNVETALPSNALTGVYFDYNGPKAEPNLVKYNPDTMRVLGVCSDGSLGFVVDNSLTTIPSNTAYLKVPAGSSPEIKCVDTATYEGSTPDLPEFFTFGEYELLPQGDDNYTIYIENFPAAESVNFRFGFTDSNNQQQYIGALSPDNSDVAIDIKSVYSYPFAYGSENSWILKNWPGGDLTININVQYQNVNFYSKGAGVNAIVAESGLLFDGHRIINNTGAPLVIYDMSGKKVAATSEPEYVADGLPKGVFIATAGGSSVKIVR